jgi:hypothetical protein
VKRVSILLVLLMAFVAACAGEQSSPSATAEPDPTVEPTDTPEPTETPEPAASGDTGSEGDLEELIPDEVNGVAGQPLQGMETIIASALRNQGIDAAEAEFAFVTYGTGESAIVLNAFRIPGMNQVEMTQLARLMSGAGADSGIEAEELTIAGKSVLRVSGGAQAGAAYLYIADDVAFTIVGQDEALAEQLLAELP